MTQLSQGFFIERVAVAGPGVTTAEIEFGDGLNVVSGASDTGKSYLCSLVDFVFGASSPRVVEQAKKYATVSAGIRDRRSGSLYEIERALAGGDVTVRHVDPHGKLLDERPAGAKHAGDDPTTLSALLLKLSGFGPAKIRKNKRGDTRTLSFRDIAFLTVVDETRIISESPPQHSGSVVERTAEGEVLRYLVTGAESVEPVVVPRHMTAQAAKAQLELMQQLITEVESELAALGLGSYAIDGELARLDESRSDLMRAYEASRVELLSLEQELAARGRSLRQADSRLAVLEGLLGRFRLLDQHYESDTERLRAVEEAGSMLEALPATVCPVCGAPPEEHRPEEAAAHYRVDDVRRAAITERQKTEQLRAELQYALRDLAEEATQLDEQRARTRTQANEIQESISTQAQPRARISAAQLQEQNSRRDVLLRGRMLSEQLRDLQSRTADLGIQSKRGKDRAALTPGGPTTAGMGAFSEEVERILTAWRLPDTGRVVFSEESQDLVVGGQLRASHGKGVRALSCSAFVSGLMAFCLQRGLPHPGLVVLDSPLVAYKDPDAGRGSESARIRAAGVKDAFYRALADGLCLGQIIVLENEDPPADVAQSAVLHHFSKRSAGRYGFFPVTP